MLGSAGVLVMAAGRGITFNVQRSTFKLRLVVPVLFGAAAGGMTNDE
jgi:hypothetical protein